MALFKFPLPRVRSRKNFFRKESEPLARDKQFLGSKPLGPTGQTKRTTSDDIPFQGNMYLGTVPFLQLFIYSKYTKPGMGSPST